MPMALFSRVPGSHEGPCSLRAASASARYAIVLICATVFLILFAAASPASAAAGAGTLDPSFVGGVAIVSPIGSFEAVALQGDGKIVSVGDCSHAFCLARHNIDGTLDTSFGVGGVVRTDISIDFDEPHAVALQALVGKIVVAGGCDLPPSFASDFCLARYNALAGSLDTSFNTTGIVTTDFAVGAVAAENFDKVTGVVIQTADGKIVAAGTCADLNVGVWRFCLARYNADGSLDGTFGSAGKVTTSIGGLDDDEAGAAALQTDGKIVVAGTCKTSSGGFDFCLVRYNTNGSLDTSFGAGGKVSTDFGSGNFANALALKDGKIVVAGKCSGAFCLARYNESDGSLDISFGVGGKVTTPIGTFDEAHAVAIQTDGKIVAAGFCYGSTDYHFCLARYNADGSLDPAFGIGGKVITPISTQDVANALAIQADGNIVVAGRCGSSSCVARYLGAGTDQAPTDITLSSSIIPENSVVGTAVGNFSTTDPDAGDTFTYTLVAGTGATDNASFTIAGRQTARRPRLRLRDQVLLQHPRADHRRRRPRLREGVHDHRHQRQRDADRHRPVEQQHRGERGRSGTTVGTLSTTDPMSATRSPIRWSPARAPRTTPVHHHRQATLKSTRSSTSRPRPATAIRVRTTDAGGLCFEKVVHDQRHQRQRDADRHRPVGQQRSPRTGRPARRSARFDHRSGRRRHLHLHPGRRRRLTDNACFTIAGSTPEDGRGLRLRDQDQLQHPRADDRRGRPVLREGLHDQRHQRQRGADRHRPVDQQHRGEPAGGHDGRHASRTTDPDAGDTFTYTLVAGTGARDNASFTIVGSTPEDGRGLRLRDQDHATASACGPPTRAACASRRRSRSPSPTSTKTPDGHRPVDQQRGREPAGRHGRRHASTRPIRMPATRSPTPWSPARAAPTTPPSPSPAAS